jgi:hypothetical protein
MQPVPRPCASWTGGHAELSSSPPVLLRGAEAKESILQGLRNAPASPRKHTPVSHMACVPDTTGALFDSEPRHRVENPEMAHDTGLRNPQAAHGATLWNPKMSPDTVLRNPRMARSTVLRNHNGAVSVSTWSDMGVQRTVTYSNAADVALALVAVMEDAPVHLRDAFRVFCVDAKASILFLSQTFWETNRRAGADSDAQCCIDRSPRELACNHQGIGRALVSIP